VVRRFNEENNEEAGEHWTPRDAVKLMASLMFVPIADQIESGTYLLYDGALGTGGMLTVAEETLQQLAKDHGKEVATHLYGQEINAETYAICKADLLLKGEGEAADNIIGGPNTRRYRTTHSVRASSISCYQIRHTVRAGRATLIEWAGRTASNTRAL
jgi:type I restriction enzyme M protein